MRYTKEIYMALFGFSLWSVSDAFVRTLSTYPTVLVAWTCAIISTLIMCAFASHLGGFRDTFYKPQLKLRLFRGGLLACSNLCAFVVFTHLDLATAYALIFAAPFFAKILSIFFTGENIRLRSWLITLFGFSGVLVVLRPGYLPMSFGVIAALVLAFLFALGYALTRYIKSENQTFLSMGFFQYALVAVCLCFPAYHTFSTLDQTVAFDFYFFAPVFCIAAFGVVGSVFVAQGYNNAPTALIAPIHYVQILWGILFGALFFGEYPDSWTLLGASIIVTSGLLLIKYTRPVA